MKKLILCLLFIVPTCFGFNQRTKGRLHGYIENSQFDQFMKLFNLSRPNITADEMQEIIYHASEILEKRNLEVEQMNLDKAIGAKIGLAASVASGAVGTGCLIYGTNIYAYATEGYMSLEPVFGAGVFLIGVPFVALGIVGGLFALDKISQATNSKNNAQVTCAQASKIYLYLSTQNNLTVQ